MRMIFTTMMMCVHLLYIQSIRLVKREERGWRVYDDDMTMNEEDRGREYISLVATESMNVLHLSGVYFGIFLSLLLLSCCLLHPFISLSSLFFPSIHSPLFSLSLSLSLLSSYSVSLSLLSFIIFCFFFHLYFSVHVFMC